MNRLYLLMLAVGLFGFCCNCPKKATKSEKKILPEVEIEKVLNEKIVFDISSDMPSTAGQLKSHYATKTPLYVGDVNSMLKNFKEKRIAVISFSKVYANAKTFMLSQKEDINEAARNLFKTLRLLDKNDFDVILAERFPDEGLGRAINDRLARAQQKNK